MSSPPQGPLSAIAAPIAEAIAQYNALPPDKKNRARATGGAGLIAFCVYVVIAAPGLLFSAWLAFTIWAALFGFGGLWLYVGVRASIAPRDIMGAFWSGIGILFFLGLMVFGAYLPDDWPFVNFLLKGFYIGNVAGCAMKLYLAIRGLPSGNLDQVRAQQAHGRAREATEAETAARLVSEPALRARQFRD